MNLENYADLASIINVCLTFFLTLGVIFAYQQFKSLEKSHKTSVMFRIWEICTSDEFKEASQIISKIKTREDIISGLVDFDNFYNANKDSAHKARRSIKMTLAPLGYLLKEGLATEEEIFPLLPAAIELWERGLKNVESDLLMKSGRVRANSKGYDAVDLINRLSEAYRQKVNN